MKPVDATLATYRVHPESKSAGAPLAKARDYVRLADEFLADSGLPDAEEGRRSAYLAAGEYFYDALELGLARRYLMRGMRPFLLMVTAQITEERLTIHWAYSKNMHRETTIRRLVESFEEAFRSLIRHSQTADANTPSDFPNANLSQLDLDKFIATIGAER